MNIHQHPGIVNQGRLAPGLETVPLLKFVGNQKIYQKDVSSDLHTQLINLLLKSGFGGTFTVVVMTKVKGTPHTRGLHVRSANAKGVVITWHQGSNDNNIQMLVCVPSRYDPMHFFSLLKQTEQCLGQQKVFEAVVSSARADPQLRLEPGNIDSIPATVEALAMSDESACPVEMRLVANNQGPLGVQEGFKYKPGPDAIELLMDELRGLATPEGVVSMERCREILVRMQYPTERLGGCTIRYSVRSISSGSFIETSIS